MKPRVTLLPWLVVAVLAGCAPRHEEAVPSVGAPRVESARYAADMAKQAPAATRMADTSSPVADAPPSFLAYEHNLTLDVPDTQVAVQHARLVALCAAVAQGGCTVLESRLDATSGRVQGTIRVRVAQAAVKPFLAEIGRWGPMASQSTTVEDLAQPMADADKRIAMLTAYRTQLEALRAKSSQDIETAMKIVKEWTQVQTELESVSGEKAFLLKRVQTELVTVSIQSVQTRPVAEPVRDALVAFSTHVAEAVAGLITFVAYALPWGVGLGGVVMGGRKLWKRRQRLVAVPPPAAE